MQKFVGPHVSAQGGVDKAPLNAVAVKAQAFGLFVKNQRQWKAPPLPAETIAEFKKNIELHGYEAGLILPHAGYLINLANPDPEANERSVNALIDELGRCRLLGLTGLNLHPGSYLRLIEPSAAMTLVATAINRAHAAVPDVAVILENTAGQGASLGASFEELAEMIAQIEDRKRVGICLDTAHLFAAGFDLREEVGYQETMEQFGKIVGFSYLRGMHLNDSKVKLGSRVDRHAPLGEGALGWTPFKCIMQDARLDKLPLILETPEEERWATEIEQLYDLI